MNNINNLKSKKVFYFFEEISKIPRGSYNEKAISEYLVNFAKERNLQYYTDELFNVIIKKEGTSKFKNSNIVALQGHTDMVCEKNKDTNHDFLKDSIKLIYDGDTLKADKTTLGADNGIAVAMALAILDSKDIEHPSIEAIFTSAEEIGMDGAAFIDSNQIKAKYLLNLDSEDEGVFTVGCAGGAKMNMCIPIEYTKTFEKFSSYLLNIKGLFGGHSGIDISKERANSNKLLIRILKMLNENFEIQVNNISGGSKDNAIPREAEAIISFDEDIFDDLNLAINNITKTFLTEYEKTEKNINISISKIEKNAESISQNSLDNIIFAGYLLPNGVQTMSKNIEGLPESSMNIGVFYLNEQGFNIIGSIRSAISSKKQEIIQKIHLISNKIGAKVEIKGDYPAWEYNENSELRKKCIEIYENLTNQKAKIDIIHAGLECGLLYEKLPNIDIISFGPNIYNPHTPIESVSISSVERTFIFLLELLKNLD